MIAGPPNSEPHMPTTPVEEHTKRHGEPDNQVKAKKAKTK